MLFWAPDDGRKNGPKHVERLREINKPWNVASCWLYSANIITECFVCGSCQIEASGHSATTCHKIGKRNTQNKCRPKHSYDGNELALWKTKLIYYSFSAISHAYTMCHLYMWLLLQTFILNRISTVMSLLDRFLCIVSPWHVTRKNGSRWRGLSTHLTGLVLAAVRQELQEFSSAVHVQSFTSCEAAGIFRYFVYRYICVSWICNMLLAAVWRILADLPLPHSHRMCEWW